MKHYIIQTRGSASCPMWQLESDHVSDKMAVEYWVKYLARYPNCFPADCWTLVIFESGESEAIIAELNVQGPRTIVVKKPGEEGATTFYP